MEDKTIERLLALIVINKMSESTDREIMLALSTAGLSNADIAAALGKTSGTVRQ